MKDKNVAALLALFLGSVGAHKFYLGRPGWGLVYLMFSFTMIPMLIGWIEFISFALMNQEEFNRRYNSRVLPPGQPMVVNMLPPGHPSAGYPGYGPGYGAPGYPPPGSQYHPGPHPLAGQAPAVGGSQPDIVAKIEKLNELRIAGLLTEDEFQQQKQKLLDAM